MAMARRCTQLLAPNLNVPVVLANQFSFVVGTAAKQRLQCRKFGPTPAVQAGPVRDIIVYRLPHPTQANEHASRTQRG